VKNRAAINAAVEACLVTETTAYWIDKLNAAGVPCGRVMELAEVFTDPQVLDQQMVLDQEHPGHGAVRMLGFPIKFGEAPCALRRPTPEIGADTGAILAELGYSAAEIAALRDAGVV
jgi:crotonobetainyl-CoA:carnitine CoA-transferase CaiB-like acyl-CoA transferase